MLFVFFFLEFIIFFLLSVSYIDDWLLKENSFEFGIVVGVENHHGKYDHFTIDKQILKPNKVFSFFKGVLSGRVLCGMSMNWKLCCSIRL